jgi:hypothetical protein
MIGRKAPRAITNVHRPGNRTMLERVSAKRRRKNPIDDDSVCLRSLRDKAAWCPWVSIGFEIRLCGLLRRDLAIAIGLLG